MFEVEPQNKKFSQIWDRQSWRISIILQIKIVVYFVRHELFTIFDFQYCFYLGYVVTARTFAMRFLL